MWKVYLWGGASYVWPDTPETFSNLADAAGEYDRRHSDTYYPCWGEAHCSSADEMAEVGRFTAGHAHWVDHVEDDHAEYPDRLLTVGPRGGLRWERC